jgi:hypothetical protein
MVLTFKQHTQFNTNRLVPSILQFEVFCLQLLNLNISLMTGHLFVHFLPWLTTFFSQPKQKLERMMLNICLSV